VRNQLNLQGFGGSLYAPIDESYVKPVAGVADVWKSEPTRVARDENLPPAGTKGFILSDLFWLRALGRVGVVRRLPGFPLSIADRQQQRGQVPQRVCP
jgi:hypothetical protein